MWHCCRHETALEKVRAEGRSAAESARGDVVEPLREEVERMRQQLEEAQAMYEVSQLLLSTKASVEWIRLHGYSCAPETQKAAVATSKQDAAVICQGFKDA